MIWINYMLDLQKNQCVDMYGNQYALQNNNITSMYPDYSQPASLEFDGQNLIWLQNGQPIKYYSAMSGKPNHQTARDMSIPDEGPIPEGRYILPRNSGEHHEPGEWRTFDEFISNINLWKTNSDAWGYSRIPIRALPETNTFGRHSMYVHGGITPGSAGCIDLTGNMEDFYRDFLNYNGDLSLEVKYPKGW